MTCAAITEAIANAGLFCAPAPSASAGARSDDADAFSLMLSTFLPEGVSAAAQDNEPAQSASEGKEPVEQNADPQLSALAALFAGVPLPSPIVPLPKPDHGITQAPDVSEKADEPISEITAAGPGVPAATSDMKVSGRAGDAVAILQAAVRGPSGQDAGQLREKGAPRPLQIAFTARISPEAHVAAPGATAAPQTAPQAEVASPLANAEPARVVVQPQNATTFPSSPSTIAPALPKTQDNTQQPAANSKSENAMSASAGTSPQQGVDPVKASTESSSQNDRHSSERRPSNDVVSEPVGVQTRTDATPSPVHPVSASEPASTYHRTSPSGPREMPAPVPQQPAAETPRPQQPVQNLRLKVGVDDLRSVDLNISQRGSALQVSVRSADPSLNASLREHLPTLAENVQRSGYRMEAPAHDVAANGSLSRQEHTPEVSQQGAAWQQEQEGGRQARDREQPVRKRRAGTNKEQVQFSTVLEVL